MANIELLNNRIEIRADFRDKELIKSVPGANWDDQEKVWHLPLSWAGCIQLRSAFGDRLNVGPTLATWARGQRDGRVNPCLELRTAKDAPELAHGKVEDSWLRPFQRAGVKFLTTAGQALLADEMGTGKTPQTIRTLENLGDAAYPALIVAPNSMRTTWKREFAKWAPERTVVVIGDDTVPGKRAGTTKKAKKEETVAKVANGEADVLVVNWEALRTLSRCAGWYGQALTEKEKEEKALNTVEWKTVVADEAHKAKDPKSQQTRALWWLGQSADYRYCLTGTPVANSPEDVWALMRFVAPEEYPAKTKFLERYAQVSDNGWGGRVVSGIKAEASDELFKILDARFIRRTKAAVLPELPAKQYTKRYVSMSPAQDKIYRQMEARMVAELEDGEVISAPTALAQLTRLLQFAAATGEIDEDNKLRLGTLDSAGQLDPKSTSCKVDALEEIVAELGGSKAAVFAESVQLIRIAKVRLDSLGYKTGLVTGDVTGQARQRFVDDFNEGRIQILLITLGAGGEGLSLTGSSVEIFLQRSFSATKNSQAEDRLHGIGRGEEGNALNIIDIITLDTAEERVWEIKEEKAQKLEEVVRDAKTLLDWITKK